MLHLKKIEDIDEADLKALISNRAREGLRIDFKREINLEPTERKRDPKMDLLKDVTAFANASGGDIIFGIEAEKGVASKMAGMTQVNFDGLERQIMDICRTRIDPPINGLRFRTIDIDNGSVFLIRIPKTWNGPHMVMRDEHRCWIRDHSQNRRMEMTDLRQALAFSTGAAERMKRFRAGRIGQVISRETPIPLGSNRCMILHLLPLVSFTGNHQVDPSTVNTGKMRPMGPGDGWSETYTLEGRVTFRSRSVGQPLTYFLIQRDGVIESVKSLDSQSGTDGTKNFTQQHFKMLIEGLSYALNLYQELSVPTPVFGAISLTGVKGYSIDRVSTTPKHPLVHDTLVLPEFLIEDLSLDAKFILKPAFDVWWQACGYSKCQFRF